MLPLRIRSHKPAEVLFTKCFQIKYDENIRNSPPWGFILKTGEKPFVVRFFLYS